MTTYCKLQCKQVAITHMSGLNGGVVKPCCHFKNGKDIDWNNNKIQTINSFNEVLNTNEWKKLRELEAPDNCIFCVEGEKIHSRSLRAHWNKILEDDKTQLEMMHISVDSLCNMSCLSCSPVQSSSWNKKTNLKELSENGFSFKRNNELTSYVDNFKRVAANTDYSKLKILKMGGGEPFYSDNVFWFLNLLDSKIDISNVELWLNTNASIIPKDNIWQLIKKFKVVNIEMSIDAVDEYHEYVRYGSKWSDILSFIKFIKDNKTDNMYLKAHSVYSILNFNVYNKILNFFAENNIEFTYTILQYPKHLSVLNLPKVFRKFYKLEKIDESPYYFTNQDIIRRIKTVFLTKINETIDCDIEYETNGYLKKYLSLMEKENNNNLKDYNPELVKIIDEFNL